MTERAKKKRGRPRRRFARTRAEYDEIIHELANSMKLVETPEGNELKSLFAINALNVASKNPSVRLGAKAFVALVQGAAEREDNRRRREKHTDLTSAQYGGL